MTIVRDEFGVAHVTGKTRGGRRVRRRLGDRGRSRAPAPAHPRPGAHRGARRPRVSTRSRSRCPARRSSRAREAEAFLANQLDALRAPGRDRSPKILALVNAYAAGINGYYRAKGIPATPFTANDVVASAALIAARFGANGGHEVQNSMFLDALDGPARRGGRAAGLRGPARGERPGGAGQRRPGAFPQRAARRRRRREASSLDDGSFTGAPLRHRRSPRTRSSSARSARRPGIRCSSPGPQVGYFFPEFFAEMELTGGGFDDARRAVPGRPARARSAAARTSRGARRRRRPTTSTCSSRRSATTTGTTCTAASASRCAASSSGRSRRRASPTRRSRTTRRRTAR